MKCDSCGTILCFDFVESEKRQGLASIFTIRCHNCLFVKKVPTSNKTAVEKGKSLYEINAAAALGCIDSGVGHEQLKTLLTAMDVPTVNHKLLKKCEEKFGEAFVRVADRSCWNAILEEKVLTLADHMWLSRTRNSRTKQRKTTQSIEASRNK